MAPQGAHSRPPALVPRWPGSGGLFVPGTFLLKSIVEEGDTVRDRTSAAPALLLLLPLHARREPVSVPVCLHFADSFGSTQGRLTKAILEYAILQGSSFSP